MDRRTIWAILLMMVIAIAPAILLKKPAAPATQGGEAGKRGSPTVPADTASFSSPGKRDSIASAVVATDSNRAVASPPTGLPADHIVRVVAPLYTYGISTRGARLVEATLSRYRSMEPADHG